MGEKVKRVESRGVPVFFWGLIPAAFIINQILLEIFTPPQYLKPMHTEGGPHEALQFIIVAVCMPLAAYMAFKVKDVYLKLWLALCALGCFYIAGEEISWGQHIFGWTTPEFWSAVNDQNETNLHNTSAWLDQKPRLLLFIGCVVGGIIVPALRRWKPSALPPRFSALYPSDILLPAALGVLLPYSVEEIAEHFYNAGMFHRVSEVQEIYIYYFIFLYLLDFKSRIFSTKSYEKDNLSR